MIWEELAGEYDEELVWQAECKFEDCSYYAHALARQAESAAEEVNETELMQQAGFELVATVTVDYEIRETE